MIKLLNDLHASDIQGKKVLVRVDFNVPVKDEIVVDDYRIIRALPTVKLLSEAGARIILISHIETKEVENPTLQPVFDYLSKQFPLSFADDCLGEEAKAMIEGLKDGEVLLCENLRRHEGEKKNDPDFAKHLASLADMYVNDAFAVSHRSHASVVGIPKFLPSYVRAFAFR